MNEKEIVDVSMFLKVAIRLPASVLPVFHFLFVAETIFLKT
jgi:hypothetical protein